MSEFRNGQHSVLVSIEVSKEIFDISIPVPLELVNDVLVEVLLMLLERYTVVVVGISHPNMLIDIFLV